MTPAAVSKRYPLNEYVGYLKDPNKDKIGETSAELMLDKNKMTLSKIAFGQEKKKEWREGVPLAAFPYIEGQGKDPIAFSAEVQKITEEKALNEAIAQLPPEQQQQALMMKELMQQAEQQPQQMAQGQPQGQPPGMAQQQMAPQGQPMPPQ